MGVSEGKGERVVFGPSDSGVDGASWERARAPAVLNFHLFYSFLLLSHAKVTLPYFTFRRSATTCTLPILGLCDSTTLKKLLLNLCSICACRGCCVHSCVRTALAECGNHLLCESRVVSLNERLITDRSTDSGAVRVLRTGPPGLTAQPGRVCLLNQRVNSLDWTRWRVGCVRGARRVPLSMRSCVCLQAPRRR